MSYICSRCYFIYSENKNICPYCNGEVTISRESDADLLNNRYMYAPCDQPSGDSEASEPNSYDDVFSTTSHTSTSAQSSSARRNRREEYEEYLRAQKEVQSASSTRTAAATQNRAQGPQSTQNHAYAPQSTPNRAYAPQPSSENNGESFLFSTNNFDPNRIANNSSSTNLSTIPNGQISSSSQANNGLTQSNSATSYNAGLYSQENTEIRDSYRNSLSNINQQAERERRRINNAHRAQNVLSFIGRNWHTLLRLVIVLTIIGAIIALWINRYAILNAINQFLIALIPTIIIIVAIALLIRYIFRR